MTERIVRKFPHAAHPACRHRERRASIVPREITDAEGIAWTCIQAFAGLGNDPEKQEAARLDGSDKVHVVCTPSGGARSRRLALPPDWEAMDDALLLRAIERS